MEALILDAAPFLTSTLAIEPASLAGGNLWYKKRTEQNGK